jgi:hypothetical protein
MLRSKRDWIATGIFVAALHPSAYAQMPAGQEARDREPSAAAAGGPALHVDGAAGPTSQLGAPEERMAPVLAPPPLPPQPAVVPAPPVGGGPAGPPDAPAGVKGKWNPTFYGFIEFDMIHDSTQSFSSACPGYVLIAKPGTFAGEHGRTIFDPRATRFGFKLAAPEMDGMKATGAIEVDFFGNQLPTNYGTASSGISEGATYTNGLLRLRHAYVKVETPYVDVLAGQYWQLFGWAPFYLPVTTQIPGLPGLPFGRNPQFRLSRTFKTDAVNIELAAAAVRPPQRNSSYPDAQGGVRLMLNKWRGVIAYGAVGGAFLEMPGGLGVSGLYRRFKVAEFVAAPTARKETEGGGVSVDVFMPIIPSTMNSKGNALNVTANFTYGKGIADMYSPGVPGGAGFPALPNPTGASPAPTWSGQDIDNGILTYDLAGNIYRMKWQTFFVGGQYYLPPSGRVWIAGNYGQAKSSNIANFDLAPEKVVKKYTFWDAVLYVNVVGPANIAAEFCQEKQTYGDDKTAKNNRVVLSTFYTFY